MNLVIVNENTIVVNALTIDIIKVLNGVYDVNSIEKELVNFYFNKVIIDITAIKNYFSSFDLFEFLNYFGKDKVILLLNDSAYCNSKEFLTQLINNGYYNFTSNSQGVSFLVNRSNTYEDVKKYIQTTTFTSELNSSIGSTNIQARTNNIKIIGIKNLSEGAGSTTLMQQMVKQLAFNYKVKGIELNGFDAIYFRRPDIIFCNDYIEAETKIQGLKGIDAIIIDLNEFEDKNKICTDIIYLLEPGIIRISKFIKNINKYKDKLNDMKIVLNRSALKDEEINYFEKETGLNIYYNLTNFDDKKDRLLSIDRLLIKLGFNKQQKI